MPEFTEAEQYLISLCRNARQLPSDIPTVQWIPENVELLPIMSDLSGKVSFEFFPASRIFFIYADNPRMRRSTVMKCSQSAFTENAYMYVMRRIVDRPVNTMWVGDAAEKVQEDVKKRLLPAIKSCKAVQRVSPDESDRERWSKRLVMFDTMNLMIRGSNAVGGLRGDPIGLIICDERADWKPGRIHKVRQRLTTKSSPVEISIGAAGIENDELHTDWKEGSQTFIYFLCPKCQKSQPFRFGKKPTVLFSEPRNLGGLIWEENDLTRPENVWNEKEFKKTVRYECEGCGHKFHNAEKIQLLKTAHEVHRNPAALPHHFSLHVNALILIWPERDWANIAWEFVKACDAMHMGDIEPLKSFTCETLGEPWKIMAVENGDGDILDRCSDYKLGDLWMDSERPLEMDRNSTLVLTFDRQLFSFPFVVRQWRKNGQSRLIDYGELADYGAIRDKQNQWKIHARCTWGDDGGPSATEFRQTCLKYNWNILKGEDYAHYSERKGEKTWRQGWRQTQFDPGVGTTIQGRALIKAWLWSNPWFKDRLFTLILKGLGPLWELPRREDVSAKYLQELTSNVLRQRKKQDGSIESYWHETGPDHFGDCELMQICVADIGGLCRTLPEEKPANSTD